MPVTPEQVEQLTQASKAAGATGDTMTPEQASAMTNSLLNPPTPGFAAKSEFARVDPSLSAPGPASPTNAAPAPRTFSGSFQDRLGLATGQFVRSGMDPMSALVAGGIAAIHPGVYGSVSMSDVDRGGAPSAPTTAPPRQPSNAAQLVRGVGASLGDIAAATQGNVPGEPIVPIMGAFRVAQAQTNRQQQEQENKVKLATANAQMVHEQALIHKLGQEEVDKSVASGEQSYKEALTAPKARPITTDKTSDELHDMVAKHQVDPSRDVFFVTGKRQVGTDANGLPIMRTTYSAMTPGGPITPSQTQIDFLNKNIPGSNFKGPDDVEEGQQSQTFDSHTWAYLNQQAMTNMGNIMTIQKLGDESEERAHKLSLERGIGTFMKIPVVMQSINAVPHVGNFDPFLGVKSYYNLVRAVALASSPTLPNGARNPNFDPELVKSLPANWMEQAKYSFGGGDIKKFDDAETRFGAVQEKLMDANHDVVKSYLDDPSKFENKTSGIIAAANSVLNDKTGRYTDEQRQNATNAKNIALDQQQDEARQEGAKTRERETNKANVEMRGSNGSAEVGEAFLNTLPPARREVIMGYINGTSTWSPRLSGSKYGQALLADIRQAAGGAWDESKGEAYVDMRKKFAAGREGATLDSANTAIHHLENMWEHLSSGDMTAGWTGGVMQFFGGNEQGRRAADDAHAVSAELGRLYTGGVVGEKEQQEWATKLDPNSAGMTVEKLKTNVREFMELLGGKLAAMQAHWDDNVPSPVLHFSKGIITQDNYDRYRQITGRELDIHDTMRKQSYGGGQTSQQQATKQAAQKGTTSFSITPPGMSEPIYFDSQAQLDAFKAKAGL
jgi:hypothetical protein